jgi:hypothetical protein
VHGNLCALEQLGQSFRLVGLGRADADGEGHAVTPPAEIRGSGKSGERLRVSCQHFRSAFMGENKELVVAPSAQLVGGSKPTGERSFYSFKHGIASLRAMGPAQGLSLIDSEPQNAEGWCSLPEVFEFSLQPFLKIGNVLFHLFVLGCRTAGQRIQALGWMERDHVSNAFAKSVAEDRDANHGGKCVAEAMTERYEGAEAAIGVRCGMS